MNRLVAVVVAWTCLATACGGANDSTPAKPSCLPGQTQACSCGYGYGGTRECREDSAWGPCPCSKLDTVGPGDPGGQDAPDAADGAVTTPDGVADGEVAPPCTYPVNWSCLDEATRYRCLDGEIQTEPCPEGSGCIADACVAQVCKPNEMECTGGPGDTAYRKCDPVGTSWIEGLACTAGTGLKTACDATLKKCVCELPVHVLFVVDASGSMQLADVSPGKTQWDVALDAISQIMNQYPFLTYGLATFPNQTVDCSAAKCTGGGGCGYVSGVNLDLKIGQVIQIQDYLKTRKLSKDQANLEYVLTPLYGMLTYLVEGYPDTGPLKTHPYPAYVVLLSDGQDSCFNPLDPDAVIGPLAARASQLLADHDVKMFTIGFNLANGQDQLDAIAMHGGTGHAKYVPANDMASLMAAFQAIFDSMQVRNCEGWSDTALPPDCPDKDGDGWCAALDCDDDDAATHFGADEVAGSGHDEDCDGVVDEPADKDLDQDSDGFTPGQGDCDDFHATVGPGGFEVPADGLDNDCDGQTDETGCDCAPATGKTLAAMDCASEISCQKAFFIGDKVYSPTGDDVTSAWDAVAHFGSASNDLAPRAGGSYALLASGPATGTSHSTDLSGGGTGTDPYSPEWPTNDEVEYKVVLKAPTNAKGFSIDYVFFSEEYDDYVGTPFNDKFYILMNAPTTTGGQTKVINFTDCRDPGTYYDLTGAECPLASGYCCYIAINTALSECCWYNGCPQGTWKTDISGTGFSCAGSYGADSDAYGSSTGWLTTSSPIEPGETFSLIFHVHDTNDGIFDSEVILDNFHWRETPTKPGTEPAN
jgi:hypothetical protein